jgi:hypothetical protein
MNHARFGCTQKIKRQFDWKFYSKMYPDLFEAGIIMENDLKNHWNFHGKKENRVSNQEDLIDRCTIAKTDILNCCNNQNNDKKDENHLFYILIRTSCRPDLFNKCIQSVLSQTYKNIRVLISYDNPSCIEYINKVIDPRITAFNMCEKYLEKPYIFNLYCNELLDEMCIDITNIKKKINNAWTIFLDDDDMFAHEYVLQILSSNINNQNDKTADITTNIFSWKFFQGVKMIELTNEQSLNPLNIKHGDISSCGYCFHSSHAHKSRWLDKRGGDFVFFNKLISSISNVHIHIIPNVFAHTVDFLSSHFSLSDRDEIDMIELTQLDDNTLHSIWKNIDYVMGTIKRFKNILFLCGDYPGYGGAATNCDNIQQFCEKKNINTFAVYWNYTNDPSKNTEDYNKNKKYIIIDEIIVSSYLLNNLQFKPDLIIFKSPCHVSTKILKQQFECPTMFFIGGIYHTSLNVPFTSLNDKEDHGKFINNDVLKQISDSDISFCNSSHTRNILKNVYNLDTKLFYSSFIPFYRQSIPIPIEHEKKNRKYEYGIIASNLSKPIKNIIGSLTRVINFGLDSDSDKKITCLCVGLDNGSNVSSFITEFNTLNTQPINIDMTYMQQIEHDKLTELYNDIDIFIQDSFFESCSNTKIEALFHGCIVI